MFYMLLLIIIPLFSVSVITTASRSKKTSAQYIALASEIILLAISVYLLLVLKNKDVLVYALGGWPTSVGITLVMDHLSVFFLALTHSAALLAIIYSMHYMSRYGSIRSFWEKSDWCFLRRNRIRG